MKHKSSKVILTLIIVIVISLGLLPFCPSGEELTADDIQHYMDSLDSSQNSTNINFIKEQAEKLAEMLFDDPVQADEFANELTEIYLKTENIDIVLVYNTGGFGGTTLAQDPEWPSILDGIQEELDELWYNSTVIEHQRAEHGVIGFIGALEGMMDYYPSKAPILATKVAFLTKYRPELKVITTGRCFGSLFSSKVMELLEDNPRVYSIQAGHPCYFPPPPSSQRTVVINDNGITPDTKASADIWAIIEANATRLPTTSPSEKGSMQILWWFIETPGHIYTWEHLGVRSEITHFIIQNFPRKENATAI